MNHIAIKSNVPLAPLSTYQLGGVAQFFCRPQTARELQQAVEWARHQQRPITILGGGSNILISEQGIAGLVIQPHNTKIKIKDTCITIGASVLVKTVAEEVFKHNLTGLEWSIGIPGFIGGAIRGNAGAHGGSFDQIVTQVTAFDVQTLEFKSFSNLECCFSYRHSLFKTSPQYIIWEMVGELKPGERVQSEQLIHEYKEYRRISQPVEPSAGCVFKNLLVAELEKTNPKVIAMAEAENKVRGGKIGVGYLIQKLGLGGYRIGGAEVSQKHANFIINTGNASAQDVLAVINYIREKVKQEYNIVLELEIQIM